MKTPNVINDNLLKGRQSFFIYHPRHNPHLTFKQARQIFDSNLKDAIEVADLYVEMQGGATPQIFSKEVLRQITSMLKDIDKRVDIYELEALAESLYGGEDAVGYRYYKGLPYYKEIQKRATELRAQDVGIVLAAPKQGLILPK